MKKKLITFTDEQAKVLDQQINSSEFIRNALDIYIEHTLTDSKQAILAGFQRIAEKLEEQNIQLQKVDKLIDYLETRM